MVPTLLNRKMFYAQQCNTADRYAPADSPVSLNKMKELLFKKTKIEYKSKYPLEISVQRLREIVKSPWNIFNLSQRICGKVTTENVYLYRVIPFVGNSFIPVFKGSFRRENNIVILSGFYSMLTVVKIFMIVWFSGITIGAIFTSIAIFEEITKNNKSILALDPMLLIPFGMILFGILLVKIGQWFSRNDITYISKIIEDTLNKS